MASKVEIVEECEVFYDMDDETPFNYLSITPKPTPGTYLILSAEEVERVKELFAEYAELLEEKASKDFETFATLKETKAELNTLLGGE